MKFAIEEHDPLSSNEDRMLVPRYDVLQWCVLVRLDHWLQAGWRCGSLAVQGQARPEQGGNELGENHV